MTRDESVSLEKIIERLEWLKELMGEEGKKTLAVIQHDIRQMQAYSDLKTSSYSDPLEVERHIATALEVMRRSSFGA